MNELLPDIERWKQEGKRVAVATVVSAYGSAPRRVGSKMAISDQGEFAGSVSGGCVENDVVEHAQQVLQERAARLVPYGISDELAFGVGLACGGQIEVFIEPLREQPADGEPVAYAYPIKGEGLGQRLQVRESGGSEGTLGRGPDLDERAARDALELLRNGRAGRLRYPDAPGGALEVFVDTYPGKPTVYIFGAVHVGVALARAAKLLDFRVVVVDARGQWATPERFPDADEIHIQHADDFLRAHPLGSNAFVAVLSHDPKLDDPALIGALPSPARYVGAIGSPKTQAERRERLAAAGLTPEQVGRLFGPIGLDIGAQSPDEIAVAILGQMLAVKNGKLAPEREPVAAR